MVKLRSNINSCRLSILCCLNSMFTKYGELNLLKQYGQQKTIQNRQTVSTLSKGYSRNMNIQSTAQSYGMRYLYTFINGKHRYNRQSSNERSLQCKGFLSILLLITSLMKKRLGRWFAPTTTLWMRSLFKSPSQRQSLKPIQPAVFKET